MSSIRLKFPSEYHSSETCCNSSSRESSKDRHGQISDLLDPTPKFIKQAGAMRYGIPTL